MRRLLLVAVCVSSFACSDGADRVPPNFRVLSPLLLTFEGQQSAVSVEVDRRARFSVIDPDGVPRGTAVAEQAGPFEVPFDPSHLAADADTTLDVLAISDSGGRTQATFTVRHGALGLAVLEAEIYDATLLTNGRLFLASELGPQLQTEDGSSEFDTLVLDGAERRVVAPGPEGDAFAAGADDVVLHYDATGQLCDRVELLPTQVLGGEADASEIVGLATEFAGGPIEVGAAHDLGFSGFAFTDLGCARNECVTTDDCELDPASAFSTGTCLITNAQPDFRASAVAIDGQRIYSGGYTFTVRKLDEATNVCVDLGVTGATDPIADIAVSQSSIWIAVGRGLSRVDRDFEIGSGVARPATDRFGEGRAAGDGLDGLPDFDVRTLTAIAPERDDGGPDGVWFGTPTGFGRIVRNGDTAEVAWVSGRSLPGRSVRAIVAPADDPGLLWVATDGGLARLFLAAVPP